MALPVSKAGEASALAEHPISNVAAVLAKELFQEHLAGVKAPQDTKLIPMITVSITYREESTK